MDAQIRSSATRSLVALLQSIAHLELEEGYLGRDGVGSPEMLAENRFIASRDGMAARLIDPRREARIPVAELVDDLLVAVRPHADELGCRDALEGIPALVNENGTAEQLRIAKECGALWEVVRELAEDFCDA